MKVKPNEIKKGLNKYLDLVIKSYERYKRAWSNEIDKPTEDGIESIINALAYIEQLEAKVERLKENNAGLSLALLYDVVNEDEQLRNEITEVAVAEAIKEFAERFKELCGKNTDSAIVWAKATIDNLVKSRVGDT
jgi:hypothetical protein